LSEEVCTSRHQLSLEVPSVDSGTFALVSGAGDDVVVVFLLQFDELWNEFWLKFKN
jgi:hypothetical protein